MFKPSKKLQKILGTYGNCAYIYRDGVVVVEEKKLRIPGTDHEKTARIAHIHPCTVYSFYADDTGYEYGDERRKHEVHAITVYYAQLIAHGFDNLRIYLGPLTDASKERRLTMAQIVFENNGHKWSAMRIHGILGGDASIYPDPYDAWGKGNGIPGSIDDWRKPDARADAVVEYAGEVEAA